MITNIKKILLYFYDTTINGFEYICSCIIRGIRFYLKYFYLIIYKVTRIRFFYNLFNNVDYKDGDYLKFLFATPFVFLLAFLFNVFSFNNNYISTSNINYENIGKNKIEFRNDVNIIEVFEDNLFKKYSRMSIDKINEEELKNTNNEYVGWIAMDGTCINYPVVQTTNNEYYLNHDFLKETKVSGWVFKDYRNTNKNDKNIIYYGHNLLNNTSFGSLSSIKNNDWLSNSNHKILIRENNEIHEYIVFSYYITKPENYYLTTWFKDDNSFGIYLDTIISRSLYNFRVKLNSNDKIITLSTCTFDNRNRFVVHAKLIR